MTMTTTTSLRISTFSFNLLILIALLLGGFGDGHLNKDINLEVTVSQIHGNDNFGCLPQRSNYKQKPTIPCKSLQYAYQKMLEMPFNFTWSLTITLIDKQYFINRQFLINIKQRYLTGLIFQGQTGTEYECTNVVSVSEAGVFYVGGMSLGQEELLYSVEFRNLCWTNFSSGACILLFNARSILVHGNKFIDNSCSAINAVDSGLQISGSVFLKNVVKPYLNDSNSKEKYLTFPINNNSAGGAVAIVFLWKNNYLVTIKKSNFSQNAAVVKSFYSSHDGQLYRNFSMHQLERIGGALAFVFAANSTKNKVHVTHCNFLENTAFSGAAVGIILGDTAKSNRILLNSCHIKRNRATTLAGGVLFLALGNAHSNKLRIQNCYLFNNKANDGGALKVIYHSSWRLQKGHTKPCSQVIEILHTRICKNRAQTASAVHFEYVEPTASKPPNPVLLKNTLICHHSPDVFPQRRHSTYTGTFLSNRVDIKFEGVNALFDNKIESAMYISNAVVNISGTLLFFRNCASTSGGALTLKDVSYLFLTPKSKVYFYANYASFKGGAIFVQGLGFSEVVYPYNPTCFMQYSVPQVPASQWEILLVFRGNRAGLKGAAVFANTISACSWKETPPYIDMQSALRWGRFFVYINNKLIVPVEKDIGKRSKDNFSGVINTDTASFKLKYKHPITAAPGETISFYLTGYDELGNSIYTVAVATDFAGNTTEGRQNELTLTNRYYPILPHQVSPQVLRFSVSPNKYSKIKKNTGEFHTIQFVDSSSAFISDVNLSFVPVPCRPGMVYDSDKRICVCNDRISGVLRCENGIIYLEMGTWANVSENGKLITYYCPEKYCSCLRPKKDKVFMGCAFDPRYPDKQCAEGRQGMLCGHCQSGYGVSLFSHSCRKCSDDSCSVSVIVLLIISVFIFSVLILAVNPGFSVRLRGPIFYVQILPYFFQSNNPLGKIIQRSIILLNLGGPGSVPFDGCFKDNFSSLSAIALTYIFPAVILLVLLVAYALHRYHLLNLRRNSPFEGFWILMVLFYKFIAETSLLLFFCVPIAGKSIFYYDGTITCFEKEHFTVAVLGFIVIVLFVIPPPFLVILISIGSLRVRPQIVDALTKGLRKSFRWWWSYDLMRRLLFVALFVFIQDWNIRQVALTIASAVIFAIHSQCSPYENRVANLGETFLLFSLMQISVLQLMDISKAQVVLSTIIVAFTAVYIVVVTVWVFVLFVRRCYRGKTYTELDSYDDSSVTHSRIFGHQISTASVCVGCREDNCIRHGYKALE